MKISNMILMKLFLPAICLITYVNGSPAGETLEPVKKEIAERFINVDSAKVGQKKDGKREISEQFQEYVEKDERAKKVFQVYRSGTGEFSMQVINLEEEVNKKFDQKTDELNENNKTAVQYETWSKIVMALGTTMVAGGVGYIAAKGSKELGGGMMVSGLAVDIASWIAWNRNLEAQRNSRAHLEQNIIMHEKWRHQFHEAKKHRHAH